MKSQITSLSYMQHGLEIHENYRINRLEKKKEAPVPWISIIDAFVEYDAKAKLELFLVKRY